MKSISVMLILLAGVTFFSKALFSGYCAEEYKALDIYTKVVKGKVMKISQLDSKITVRENTTEKEISFAITERTKVLKKNVRVSFSEMTGDVYVSLSDIMLGDQVIVEYYDNPKVSGPLAAKSIELIKQ